MTDARIFFRHLATQDVGGRQVLDIVADDADPETAQFTVFFTTGVKKKDISGLFQDKPVQKDTIHRAAFMRFRDAPRPVNAADLRFSDAEHEIFENKNVTIATHNGEPADIILDWISYHHHRHGLDGAVIFERAQPGDNQSFWEEIEAQLADMGLPFQIVVMESAMPLGYPDLPPEAHPFCVSEAPGQDRMELPDPDPWAAPLLQKSIYELARQRFLRRARAVANFNLYDLLSADTNASSPFELVEDAEEGMVLLQGQHCYPWRVRTGHHPTFGDHICVQFDKPRIRYRWCVAPRNLPESAVLLHAKVPGARASGKSAFFRFMAVRHPVEKVSKLVPKTSLVESPALVALAEQELNRKPVRFQPDDPNSGAVKGNDTTIVTTMKNEGPFILEWIAYHRAIGVTDFLVYTNDCTDGTDAFLDLLQAKGVVHHRDNPYRALDKKPQHAALAAAEDEPVIQQSAWVICMDVDEFLNVKVGRGTLPDLYAAVGDANMISCTWRLFGNSDMHHFTEGFTLLAYHMCAEEFSPKPHQAWGFKTLFRNEGIFRKLGVHRPKGLRPHLWEKINWVNGSGRRLHTGEYRNAWRSTARTYGYDLVALNHYAVRNAESFLVKRDRGRVNHVDRDQGLTYWFRMNNNATSDRSIQRHVPRMKAEFDRLMADPDIAGMHRRCVAAHREKIADLKSHPANRAFYDQLTSDRMAKLSRMHRHFGAKVFLEGPESVPDEVIGDEHDDDFFFSVEESKAS